MSIKKIIGCLSCMAIIVMGCKNNADAPDSESSSYSQHEDYNKKTQSQRTGVYSPEKELAGFTVPEGFVVELVASEKDGIVNPIDMTFDDAGDLWTQTASMYPLDPAVDIGWNELLVLMDDPEAQREDPRFKRILDLYEGKTKGDDAILVISDLYGNSSAKVSVWADGLAIPQSILPYKNGAYVAHGSELFFLSDTNNDGMVNIADVTYHVAFTFTGGPGPPCLAEGDSDGSGGVGIGDLTYNVAYIFSGGPAPVCGPWFGSYLSSDPLGANTNSH